MSSIICFFNDFKELIEYFMVIYHFNNLICNNLLFLEGNPISIPIIIQGTIINYPTSGSDPNWSQAMVDFAIAVQNALGSFVGPYDVPPQTFTMTSNAYSNEPLPNLSFPTATVQGAVISYSVYRNSTTETPTETGTIMINYNPLAGAGLKWEVSREYIGDGKVTFNVTDVGQVEFSSTTLSGTYNTGYLTYQAKAVLQNS